MSQKKRYRFEPTGIAHLFTGIAGPEKWEHKEKFEKLEQLEKRPLETGPKDIVENQPPLGPGDPVEQRLTALEQSVASMQHFITSQQRSDLSRGALSAEPAAKKSGG